MSAGGAMRPRASCALSVAAALAVLAAALALAATLEWGAPARLGLVTRHSSYSARGLSQTVDDAADGLDLTQGAADAASETEGGLGAELYAAIASLAAAIANGIYTKCENAAGPAGVARGALAQARAWERRTEAQRE